MIRLFKEKWFYIVLLLIALAVPFIMPNRYFFQVIITCCLFSIGALSMNLILGYTGQASLAHGAFFGIGAYGVAMLMQNLGWSFWIALPLSAMMTAFIGFLVGFLALRTRGAYFAITTLCLGEIVGLVISNWTEFTGGANGINGYGDPGAIPLPFIGQITFEGQTPKYYLILVFLLFTIFIMYRLVNSLKGLTFLACATNELLAEAVGINTFKTKLLSFVVSIFFVSMAGGLYAVLLGSISPGAASLGITFNFLLFVLLGGATTLVGPVLGSFVLPVLQENLAFLAEYQMIFFGALLVFVVIYAPKGFMGAITALRSRLHRKKVGA
ncbi:MAG: branched-chain amino acid ABC transporter permease [Thermodesulfobacteriota bacterium]|jgi:branched-chain amino acid transport system permease protein